MGREILSGKYWVGMHCHLSWHVHKGCYSQGFSIIRGCLYYYQTLDLCPETCDKVINLHLVIANILKEKPRQPI